MTKIQLKIYDMFMRGNSVAKLAKMTALTKEEVENHLRTACKEKSGG